MALQVTGSFQLSNGTFAIDPQIYMYPSLPYRNILNLQAQVAISGSDAPVIINPTNLYKVVDTLQYNNIDTTTLSSTVENPYSALIDALDNYVKADLEIKQPNCTFTKI